VGGVDLSAFMASRARQLHKTKQGWIVNEIADYEVYNVTSNMQIHNQDFQLQKDDVLQQRRENSKG
jgi:predicted SprT family Zn-dependent metalloprotease